MNYTSHNNSIHMYYHICKHHDITKNISLDHPTHWIYFIIQHDSLHNSLFTNHYPRPLIYTTPHHPKLSTAHIRVLNTQYHNESFLLLSTPHILHAPSHSPSRNRQMLHSFYTSAPITVVDMVFLGDQRHAVNQDLIESMKFAGIVNGISLLLYNMLILSNLSLVFI